MFQSCMNIRYAVIKGVCGVRLVEPLRYREYASLGNCQRPQSLSYAHFFSGK